ncbi:MAG: hypothetical protein ACFFBE_09620 [Promethearchaeota archaeon]
MTLQSLVLKEFDAMFQKNSLISISGESGTGKTSLVLYLVANMLTKEKDSENSCFWIQASEQFPKKRLLSMYKEYNEVSNFLLNNFYVAPGNTISSYSEQTYFIQNLLDDRFIFPPDLRFIVIDNISHHLRFQISKVSDIKQRATLLDDFYNNMLCPLILLCQREKITLILLHEVSYNVKLQKTLPFFYSLYSRIKSVNIFLKKSIFSNERVIEIEENQKFHSLFFQLDEKGFHFFFK